MQDHQLSIFVAFLAGTFSLLSPCVLPLFPSYLSFITGMSVEELSGAQSKTLKPILQNSLLFVFGFSLVFIAMGASAGFLGGALLKYRDLLQLLGGILVIFFGLYILGVIKWNLLGRYVQINILSRPLGLFGSVLIGAAFALGWTPCVGPILGSILALAASSGEANSGVALLASYSLGLAVPFLLSSFVIQQFSSLLKRFRRSLHVVHVCAGVLLVIAGILLVTGYMSILNQYALRLTPQWLWSRL
jgi:cytochrome c-type biogenesis protein